MNLYVLIAQGTASYLSACKGKAGYSKIMNYGAVRVAMVPLPRDYEVKKTTEDKDF